MAAYPKLIHRELLRIHKHWHVHSVPDTLPFPEGNEEGSLPIDVETPPGLLEQATEYHRRKAHEKLAEYYQKRTDSLAKEVAEHMM